MIYFCCSLSSSSSCLTSIEASGIIYRGIIINNKIHLRLPRKFFSLLETQCLDKSFFFLYEHIILVTGPLIGMSIHLLQV